MKVVVFSRGRADTIQTHYLMPYAVVAVPESEAEAYRKRVTENEIITYPDSVVGVGRTRNWLIDNIDADIQVQVDDDIQYLTLLTGYSPVSIKDPQYILDVFENSANMALDLGVSMFIYNQIPDVRKYRHFEPFKLVGWGGCAIGVIGKDFKFTEETVSKVDVDFALQHLAKERVLWCDFRYSFAQIREKNKGGSSLFRTKDTIKRDCDYLKNKWGGHIGFKMQKTNLSTSISVKRKTL